MSEFRLFCWGGLIGFIAISAGSMFLGPPASGASAYIVGIICAGCFAVAMFGRRKGE